MDQTVCCQPNIESIMRRLRGQGTPYTPPAAAYVPPPIVCVGDNQEVEELKQAVRVLGAKLKSAYDDLAVKETELKANAQKGQEAADSLQALLQTKEQELSKTSSSERQMAAALEEMKAALAEHQNKGDAPPLDLSLLQEEIAAFKAKETAWQEEKKTLEAFLERERQRRSSETTNTNGQMVRLAMTCKQLEEETHSLQCERAATLRQFNQIKEQLEETTRTLASERDLKAAAEGLAESEKKTIQELKSVVDAHLVSIRDLSIEREAAAQRDTSYLSTISELNVAIAKGKANAEALSASLAVAEENRSALHIQLERERQSGTEARESSAKMLKEKDAAEARVKEVEEDLIIKLQTLTELEEQLGEALSRAEEFEHRALTAEKSVERLTAEVQKLGQDRDELHEKSLKLEQQLGRSTTENTELKRRTETFERLKKSVTEASSHAQAILRTLGHGPKIQQNEETYREPERSLFEEHIEQHELF